MTRGDTVLVCLVAAMALFALPLSGALAGAPAQDVAVLQGPAGVTRVPLDQDASYVVEGSSGEVVFKVRDGALRCVTSTCPDHVCVRSGLLRPGAPIVCAPNGVTATLEARAEGDLDAISR